MTNQFATNTNQALALGQALNRTQCCYKKAYTTEGDRQCARGCLIGTRAEVSTAPSLIQLHLHQIQKIRVQNTLTQVFAIQRQFTMM